MEYLLVFLVEGMYETKEPDLSNYYKYLENYRNTTNQYTADAKEECLTGLRRELISILNSPTNENLNNWFCEHALHYLDSDQEVITLMKMIWTFFFADANWSTDRNFGVTE